jgi:hypothetical protein
MKRKGMLRSGSLFLWVAAISSMTSQVMRSTEAAQRRKTVPSTDDSSSNEGTRSARIFRSTHEGSFGAGLILGEPTGLTVKYWLGSPGAIDGGLAYSFNSFFLIYSDYLYHFKGAFGASSEFATELTPYVGGGAVLFVQTTNQGHQDRSFFRSDQGSVGLALRIPVGIEWTPGRAPFGVFVEIAPGIGIVPATFGLLQGGIGARFYFL